MKCGIYLCFVLTLFTFTCANASTIVGASGITQNTMGVRDGDVDIGNIIDQSGLSSSYASGVTDFDAYLAGSPSHASAARDNDWFADPGVTSGIIDFDLGSVYSLDRVAIWNEDATGVAQVNIFTALDSLFTGTTFVGTFTLSNNAREQDYLADVLTLTSITDARYVRFAIVDAYPDERGFADQASLGEVAFSVSTVPLPAAILLFGSALAGLIGFGRRARPD